MLGPAANHDKELRILNKVVRLTTEGIELEADPRHAELTIRDLKLENARASTVPGAKEVKVRGSTDEDDAVATTTSPGAWSPR